MPISIEADPTLAQGYLKVNGTTAATVTSTGLTTASLQNAAVTPAKLAQPYTLATAQASTSGTAIDFTGIPSWAKRITVMFNGVSTNGSSNILIQVGSGSLTTSGYNSSGGVFNYSAGTAGASSTAGFLVFNQASYTIFGHMTLTLASGSTWVESHAVRSGEAGCGGGFVTLSGALDRIRVTTVNGTDTFDAGSINISYEG